MIKIALILLISAHSFGHSSSEAPKKICPTHVLVPPRTSKAVKLLINENTTLLDAVLANEFNATTLSAAAALHSNDTLVVDEFIEEQQRWEELFNNHEISDSDEKEHEHLVTLSNRMLDLMTPFDPTKGHSTSTKCAMHTQHYFNRLAAMDIWALKMHDASAKISSGILSGNVNQFGDFDECLSIDEANGHFQGKYCLAYLQPEVPKTRKLRILHDLAQSHRMMKSNFEDPGHRVPRFSTISWGICVPSSCSHEEVEESLRSYLSNFTEGTGVEFRISVDEDMCQVSDRNWVRNLDRGTLIAAGIFLAVIFWSIYCTVYDFKHESNAPNEWMLVFSMRKNNRALFSTERERNDIESVHGIRALNAFLLIISHKSMAAFFNPYINRTEMAELIGQPWTVIARAASLYTDPFIMMSGLLTTYSLLGRLQRGQSIKVFNEYIGRFLRIAPPLGALIAFCTFILPLMGSGPQWNLVISHHSDICKIYWWRNLMFIHNYFGFENMCLTHTHHIGIDTQLHLTAPILVLILWKWPRKGFMVLLGIAGLSTVARYYVTITRGLSNYVFFGTSVAQLFDTANYMYILPAHRATVYIMGVLLGYFLRKYKDTGLKLTPKQINLGWLISFIAVCVSFFGPSPMGNINYVYNPVHAALYAAYAPIGWCIGFGWIIFTSHLGYKSTLSDVFSWKGFQVTTRFSYAVYLTQFPIFFFTVGITRSAEHYQFIRMTINYNEYFWIIFFSYFLTILFELPFANLKKLLLPTRPTRKQINPKVEEKEVDLVVPGLKEILENQINKEMQKEKTC